MELTNTIAKVDKLALLLLYLSSWEEKSLDYSVRRSWKNIDYDILERLQESGLISQSRSAKSLFLTEEGEELAYRLAKWLENAEL